MLKFASFFKVLPLPNQEETIRSTGDPNPTFSLHLNIVTSEF